MYFAVNLLCCNDIRLLTTCGRKGRCDQSFILRIPLSVRWLNRFCCTPVSTQDTCMLYFVVADNNEHGLPDCSSSAYQLLYYSACAMPVSAFTAPSHKLLYYTRNATYVTHKLCVCYVVVLCMSSCCCMCNIFRITHASIHANLASHITHSLALQQNSFLCPGPQKKTHASCWGRIALPRTKTETAFRYDIWYYNPTTHNITIQHCACTKARIAVLWILLLLALVCVEYIFKSVTRLICDVWHSVLWQKHNNHSRRSCCCRLYCCCWHCLMMMVLNACVRHQMLGDLAFVCDKARHRTHTTITIGTSSIRQREIERDCVGKSDGDLGDLQCFGWPGFVGLVGEFRRTFCRNTTQTTGKYYFKSMWPCEEQTKHQERPPDNIKMHVHNI